MKKIEHNYLAEQFADASEIWAGIRAVVERGDFTLGAEVAQFENKFAEMCGVKHAIGVGNGTDALFLALKSLGASQYQEVITTPYSFYATSAAIWNAGATPVFVDVAQDFNIDPEKIEDAITPLTVGIVPVHWAGRPCAMREIMAIARKHGLCVLEDCAHAPMSEYRGKRCGSFGEVNAFSLHPLKNVNVWGDGGVITTNSDEKATFLRRLRNHGMSDRDTCEFWGYNSRLDTVQAVVASHVLQKLSAITARRRDNARLLDNLLLGIPEVQLPELSSHISSNYYLYCFHADNRDALKAYLVAHGVDAKIHYPKPLHLQPAAKALNKGFRRGAFPIAEWCADTTLSLPVHEFITETQLHRMALLVRQFYEMELVRSLCEGT